MLPINISVIITIIIIIVNIIIIIIVADVNIIGGWNWFSGS